MKYLVVAVFFVVSCAHAHIPKSRVRTQHLDKFQMCTQLYQEFVYQIKDHKKNWCNIPECSLAHLLPDGFQCLTKAPQPTLRVSILLSHIDNKNCPMGEFIFLLVGKKFNQMEVTFQGFIKYKNCRKER